MATWAIGDIQGCRPEFEQLLEKINFSRDDQLWLVGDLINRGSDDLGTMRLILKLQAQCRVVLGNHDLHMLANLFGGHTPSASDTFTSILSSNLRDEIGAYLCQQELMIADPTLGYVMTHAGVPHIWGQAQALELAGEVRNVLRDEHDEVSRQEYFEKLYGNEPDTWSDQLSGMRRLRMITNYFTRMRMVNEQGALNFSHKGAIADAPPGLAPWFDFACSARSESDLTVLFGHWAALDGVTSSEHFIALDTGCVWGRSLTAYCLETRTRVSVNSTAS